MQLHDVPTLNTAWKAMELADDGEHRYLIIPMGRNWRLIGIDRHDVPDYGWCYKTRKHAYAGLLMWDPVTHDEPLLWHKRAGEHRRAPWREANPEYNQTRCVHGSYLNDRACDVDRLCIEMRSRQGTR